MTAADVLGLFGFVAACFVAALTGAFFRPGEWYRRLDKPRWTPPDWLFAPAWSVLYLLIAASGWLVWRRAGFGGAAAPLAIYGVQLVLNGLWSVLFFGLRRPDWAFAELVVFWLAIAATIVAFAGVDPTAAWLLSPYLVWVTFAGALNCSIWLRNRERIAAAMGD